MDIKFELSDEQINEFFSMLDTLKCQLTPTGDLARTMLGQFEEKYCREVSRGNNIRPKIEIYNC